MKFFSEEEIVEKDWTIYIIHCMNGGEKCIGLRARVDGKRFAKDCSADRQLKGMTVKQHLIRLGQTTLNAIAAVGGNAKFSELRDSGRTEEISMAVEKINQVVYPVVDLTNKKEN